MSLDVVAYEEAVLIVPASEEEASRIRDDADWMRDGVRRVWVSSTRQADGLVSGGYYRVSGQSVSFCAGSYANYGAWRSHLAQMAEDGPSAFEELINFSDCCGVIGPQTSAKLAADFAAWQGRAEAYARLNPVVAFWIEKYNDWRAAFEIAAHGGYVDFL